jgi:hypothetical protein
MYRENMWEGKQEGLNDFVLKTLLMLDWYYQITADRAFMEALYPNYHSMMGHILDTRLPEGYFTTSRVFFEWTKIDKTADLTAYQALLVECFGIMEELAIELGYEKDAQMYASEAEKLREVVNTHFWDEQRKVYRDGFKDGKPIGDYYPISSIYPLLFDLSTSEKKQKILQYLDEELKDIGEETRNRRITPYGSFYLFSALYREDRADIAERFMLQYWSRMIHQGDDTSWENFDIGGEKKGGQGTASHAWSGHPTYFLSTEVLGVNLGNREDFRRDRIDIEPISHTLSWARGTVPHPAGEVMVNWRVQGDRLVLEVELPGDVDYSVNPRGRLAGLELDLEVKIRNSF